MPLFIRARIQLIGVRLKKVFKVSRSKARATTTSSHAITIIPGMATATAITMSLGLPHSAAVAMTIATLGFILLNDRSNSSLAHIIQMSDIDFDTEFAKITKNI